MNCNLLLYILLTVPIIKYTRSAKILATIFTPSYSHQVAFRPLWKELSKRGHDITLLTTDPMKDSSLKNIKEIDLSGSYAVMELYGASDLLSKGRSSGKSIKKLLDDYVDALSKTANWQLNYPEVKHIINNRTEYFDLIIIEMMFPTHLGFVDRFNSPFIGVTSLDALPRIHRSIGNFMHPVVYPDYTLPFTKNLTFLQRLISVFFSWFMWIYEYFMYQTEYESAKKHFGNDIRPLAEIEKDMSMLFINVNPIFHHIRPLGPNTIKIGGGTHLTEAKPLPEDIESFVEKSAGVIYFSLGTNVKSVLINDDLKSVILDTFSELPYKIIWKFEESDIPKKPANVKILKWVPQQDLLRHPNTVLFITQCGLQSMEEAIFNHVPMVGMPFFGDQPSNAKMMESKGMGLVVNQRNLTKEDFKRAILEVIQNPIYRNRVKEISELTNDVEITGLEKAVWWTEYTIRTKGAKHLRSPSLDIPTYQYYLLDVIAFVVLVLFIFILITVKLLKLLFRLICCRKRKLKTQ